MTNTYTPTQVLGALTLKNIRISFTLGEDCSPAQDGSWWDINAEDTQGRDWYANLDFVSKEAAEAFLNKQLNEADWVCNGLSYAMGKVDEYTLMDSEEQAYFNH